MCGIVGYIGRKEAVPVLMDGLSRLSYRGYDSAGIAVVNKSEQLIIRKTQGKLIQLEKMLKGEKLDGCIGIGHTRWATHGIPSNLNAHPHTDSSGRIAVVHNGIIENHEELANMLRSEGVYLQTQTDTEVAAHLLNRCYSGDMVKAIRTTCSLLQGSYALGIICEQEPDKLFCVRCGSPLIVGYREGEGFIASDIPALLSHTRDMVFLQDAEIAVVSHSGITVYSPEGGTKVKPFFHVEWTNADAEKEGYPHFMLKEIHEQAKAVRRTISGRNRSTEWLPISDRMVREIKCIRITACGTAYHAGVFGKYVIEELAAVPTETETASEYRYRRTPADENELVIAVSQSGETADTLGALRKARENHLQVAAICNVVGSTLAREAGEGNTLYTYAGPEISVASTKAYLTQAVTLLLFGIALAQKKQRISAVQLSELQNALEHLPDLILETLKKEGAVRDIARNLKNREHVYFVGRGLDYPIAMEASLKLKEISYIHAEAYPAGELKHGPLALIQQNTLVVAAVTQQKLTEKTISNLQEIKARGGRLLVVTTSSIVSRLNVLADDLVVIPDSDPLVAPLLAMIPLQLFAYFIAVERGCDVDQPRNLAKSVTVE